LLHEWSAAGLSERISEVTLVDLYDVGGQLAGKDLQIEGRLGSQDPGRRLKMAIGGVDEDRQTPRGTSITYGDVAKDRVSIGSSAGNRVSADSATERDHRTSETEAPAPNANTTDRKNQNQPSENSNRGKNDARPGARDQPNAAIGRFR